MAYDHRYVPEMENQQDVFDNFLNKTVSPRWPNGVGDSDHHLVTIFGLTLQIRAKKILELGVRWGDTSEPMVCAASMVGGHLTSVDISPTLWKCPTDLKDHYTFIQSDAIKFLEEEVKNEAYYDMVYIDDWHAYEHVKREIELVDKLTDKKSLILLHDLMAFGDGTEREADYHNCMDSPVGTEWSQGGPTRAVLELDKNKWEWVTVPINNGLTILRKIY
jgi:predicted O-methyltransferase YrrM